MNRGESDGVEGKESAREEKGSEMERICYECLCFERDGRNCEEALKTQYLLTHASHNPAWALPCALLAPPSSLPEFLSASGPRPRAPLVCPREMPLLLSLHRHRCAPFEELRHLSASASLRRNQH